MRFMMRSNHPVTPLSHEGTPHSRRPCGLGQRSPRGGTGDDGGTGVDQVIRTGMPSPQRQPDRVKPMPNPKASTQEVIWSGEAPSERAAWRDQGDGAGESPPAWPQARKTRLTGDVSLRNLKAGYDPPVPDLHLGAQLNHAVGRQAQEVGCASRIAVHARKQFSRQGAMPLPMVRNDDVARREIAGLHVVQFHPMGF